jgi:Family of unknown function (DUF6518)
MQSSRYVSLAEWRPGDRPAARIAVAAVIGILVGSATSFAQAHLDLPWAALANSASPWLLGGFAAGAVQLRRGSAIAAGFVTCGLEVASYYATTAARGFPVSPAWIAFWAACALVGGPVFGWAGWAWRLAAGWWQALGASLAASTFLAEGLGAYQFRLRYESSAILYLVIGAVLLVLALLLPAGTAAAASATGGTAAGSAGRPRPIPVLACAVVVTTVGLLIYGPLLSALTGTGFTG